MLTTEERQIEFVELVKEMRAAQKEFLKSKSQTVLEDARFYYAVDVFLVSFYLFGC